MRIKFKRYAGVGLLGWIVSIPLVLIGLLILVVIFFEARKAYWDHRVKELCEKHGGIKIYETVQLDKDEYRQYLNQDGKLFIPSEEEVSHEGKYIRVYNRYFINHSNPIVRKHELLVKRMSDNKIIGRRISYSRVGGDIIAFHPSKYSCPSNTESLFNAVLIENEEE